MVAVTWRETFAPTCFMFAFQDSGTQPCVASGTAPAAPWAEPSAPKETAGGIRTRSTHAPSLTATAHLQLYVPTLRDLFFIWRGDTLAVLCVSSTLCFFRRIIASASITVSATSLHMLVILKTALKKCWKQQQSHRVAVRRVGALWTASNWIANCGFLLPAPLPHA